MEARIEMHPVREGGGTYVPKLRSRDGDLIDNGAVVVISGTQRNGQPLEVNGRIGVLDITPGRECVIVKAGGLHCGVDLYNIRALKMGETVEKP